MKKRITALVLVLALLWLPACQNKKPQETAPTAADIFREKVSYTEQLDSFHRELEITAKKSMGIFEYEEEEDISEDFAQRTTDSPIALVETKSSINDESYKMTEQYLDGKLYLSVNKTDYVADVSFEDYEYSQYPLALLDPANYKTVTYDEKAGVFQFKDATALESWMVPEYAKLVSAEGTAKLDSAGNIEEMTYTASYIQGPMTVDVTYVSTLEETDLTAEDLSPEEDAMEVSNMYIPLLLARTEAALELEAPVSAVSNVRIISQAYGCYYGETITMDLYEKDDLQLGRIRDSIYIEELDQTYEYEDDLLYKDGKTTYIVDGEENKLDWDYDDYQFYVRDELGFGLQDLDEVKNAEITQVGDFWLIEYDLDKETREDLHYAIHRILLNDAYPDLDYVDGKVMFSAKGWVSVDMDTLLPVSVGISVNMAEIIEGQQYMLDFESVQNLEIGDPDAYEAVMEEPFPDEEPETKPTPVFYEVTDGKGGKMYLLGTIHIGEDATAYLPTAITDALKASDALALEINVDTLEDRMETDEKLVDSYRQGILYTDGTLTASKLDWKTAEKLDQMIKAYGKQPNMEYALPSVFSSQFSYAALDFNNGLYTSKGVDYRLLRTAEEHGIEITEVEDVYENVSMASRYSETTQKYLLESGLEVYRATEVAGSWELYTAWCRGDETELRELINAEDEDALAEATEEELAAYEEYIRILMTERDAQMTEKAKEYVASGETVFMAVGLAHVLGENGIVDSLREAGYTVTKVEY